MMKTPIFMIAFMIVGIVAQAQPYHIQNAKNESGIKERFPAMRHSVATLKNSARNNTLLPLEGLYYYGERYHCPYDTAIGTITYKYHDDWRLREIYYDVFPHIWGFHAEKVELNNTFILEGTDMPDTITYYSISNGIYTPYDRIYYNYHYYDILENDSFFFEYTKQHWDPVHKKWNNLTKDYEGFVDTVLWNNTRYIKYRWTASGWEATFALLDTLIYDEQGFVTARMASQYVAETGTTDRIKYDYYLNEDGSIYAIDIFFYQNNQWVLKQKKTDITWDLWLGYGGFDVIGFADKDNIPINGKRNKQTFETYWYKEGDEWIKYMTTKKYWDIDDCGSNTDTIFFGVSDENQTAYPWNSLTFRFDQYGNETERGYIGWDFPDEEGNQLISGGTRYENRYYYNDTGCYKMDEWTKLFNTDLYRWDSLTTYKEEVTKWIDPLNSISELSQSRKQPLSIAPNPVSGVVTIVAATEIKQLQIFDITGKLMKEQVVSADKAVFDTGNLPKGIYIVQALLQNGERKMGKIVVP